MITFKEYIVIRNKYKDVFNDADIEYERGEGSGRTKIKIRDDIYIDHIKTYLERNHSETTKQELQSAIEYLQHEMEEQSEYDD